MARRHIGRHAPAPPARPDATEVALRIAIDARLPFAGLRDRTIDYRLFHYVPFAVAVREAVVPLSLDADALTVAAATDTPDLTETRTAFPSLPVRLVIAPRPEIHGILERARQVAA